MAARVLTGTVQSAPLLKMANPRVYFDITAGGAPVGRIVMEVTRSVCFVVRPAGQTSARSRSARSRPALCLCDRFVTSGLRVDQPAAPGAGRVLGLACGANGNRAVPV